MLEKQLSVDSTWSADDSSSWCWKFRQISSTLLLCANGIRHKWKLPTTLLILTLNGFLFKFSCMLVFPSVLWYCWLGDRKGIRPVKKLGVCVGGDSLAGALHVSRLQLSPLTTSIIHSSNNIQNGDIILSSLIQVVLENGCKTSLVEVSLLRLPFFGVWFCVRDQASFQCTTWSCSVRLTEWEMLTPVLSQSRRVLKEPMAKRSPSGLQLTAVMG